MAASGSALKITPNVGNSAIVSEIQHPTVSVSNFTVTYGDPQQFGLFSNGTASVGPGASVGITQGLVVGTGLVKDLPYDSKYLWSDSYLDESKKIYKDPDIRSLKSKAFRDTVVLEFDVVAQRNNLNFVYVFGSEEHPYYSCSGFNDVYGFFVSGPGISGTKNLALLPGNGEEISVKNINDEKCGKNNQAYFRKNYPGKKSDYSDGNVPDAFGKNIVLNGLTVPITTTHPVTPGSKYHVKIGIADTKDNQLNAAVFLRFIRSSWSTTTDAEISLSASGNPATGEQQEYVVRVANTGSASAPDTRASVPIPTGFSYISHSGPGSYSPSTGQWIIGSLGAGKSQTLRLLLRRTSSAATNMYAEITSLGAEDTDSEPGFSRNFDDKEDGRADDDEAALSIPYNAARPADLSVQAGAGSANPQVGASVSLTAKVSNAGSGTASGIVVSAPIPSGFSFQSSNMGSAYNASTGAWSAGSLGPGGSRTLTITAKRNSGSASLFQTQITASSAGDPDSSPSTGFGTDDLYDGKADDDEDSVSFPVQVVPKADLALSLSVDNAAPTQGSQIEFSLQLSNNGPNAVSSSSLKALLPSGLSYVSHQGGTAYNSSTGIWTLGSIASGASITLKLRASAASAGAKQLNAEVTASALPDPNSSPTQSFGTDDLGDGAADNDEASVSVAVVAAPTADLELTLSVDNATPTEGDQVEYRLRVWNRGPSQLTAVSMKSLLPAGMTYVSHLGGVSYMHVGGGRWNAINISSSYNSTSGLWTLGTFPVNSYTFLRLRARADTAGTKQLRAEITASTLPDPNSSPAQSFGVDDLGDGAADNDEASVSVNVQAAPRADLALSMTVDKAAPTQGEQVEFSLVVTNSGPGAISSASLKALLPAGLSYVSHQGGTAYNSATGVWTLGSIASGASQTLKLRASAISTGAKQLQAEITASNLLDPNSSPTQSFGVDDLGDGTADNDEVSLSVNVAPPPQADMRVSLSVDKSAPAIGDQIRYTIGAFNDGPSEVSASKVQIRLPAGQAFASINISGWKPSGSSSWSVYSLPYSYTNSGGVVTVTLGALPSPSYARIWLNANVTAPGTQLAQAEITASNVPDPNSSPTQSFGVDDLGDGKADNDETSLTINVAAPPADLALSMSVDNAAPTQGNQIEFTLVLANNGPNDVSSATLKAPLPAGLSYVSHQGGAAYNSTTGVWTLGSIASGASQTLKLRAVTVSSGTKQMQAEISASSAPDPNSSPTQSFGVDDLADGTADNDEASLAVNIAAAPTADLTLTLTVDKPTPTEGDEIEYRLLVANSGPQPVTAVSMKSLLPAGLSYVSHQSGPSYVHAGGGTWNTTSISASYNSTTGLWTLGTFPVNSYTLLRLRARADTTGAKLLNAEITASSLPDPNSSPAQSFGVDDLSDGAADNDEASISVNVLPAPKADLALSLSVDNASPAQGAQIEFTLQVTNNGPEAASSSALKALLPSGLTYISHQGGTAYNSSTGAWTLGSIASGASQTLKLRASAASSGAKQLQAEITASTLPDPNSSPTQSFGVDDLGDGAADNDEASLSVNVQPPPQADMRVSLSVNNSSPTVGNQIRYTVGAYNDGPLAVSASKVQIRLPAGQTFASINISGWKPSGSGSWSVYSLPYSYSYSSGVATVTLGALPSPSYARIWLNANVTAPGAQLAQAEITSSTLPDPNSSPTQSFGVDDLGDGKADNDESSLTVNVPVPPADLALSMSVDNVAPTQGDQIEFSLQVANNGPGAVSSSSLKALLPSGLSYVSHQGGNAYNSSTGIWTLGSIASGASQTLKLRAYTASSGTKQLQAEITASSATDPNSSPTQSFGVDDLGDGIADNDEASLSVNVAAAPLADMRVRMFVDKSTPAIGDQIRYTTNAYNDGPSAVSSSKIQIRLPAGQSFASINVSGWKPSGPSSWSVFSLPYSYTFSGGLVTVTVGALPTPSYARVMLNANVTAAGTQQAQAEIISSSVLDPNSSPTQSFGVDDLGDGKADNDETSISVNVPAPTADLALSLTADTVTPTQAFPFDFTLQVTNNGPNAVSSSTLKALLPSGLNYVSHQGGTAYNSTTGLWTLGNIASGVSLTLKLRASAPAVGTKQLFAEITASAASDPNSNPAQSFGVDDLGDGQADNDEASLTVNVLAQPADLAVTMSVDNAAPTQGDEIEFTFQVTNNGPSRADTSKLKTLLPAGLTYVSHQAGPSFWKTLFGFNAPINIPVSYDSTTSTWSLGFMHTGAFTTLKLRARAVTAGAKQMNAEISASSAPDPNSSPTQSFGVDDLGDGIADNDEASLTVNVQPAPPADLALTLSVSKSTPTEGDVIEYRLRVDNKGPQPVTAVSLKSLLPAGMSYVSHDAGSSFISTGGGGSIATSISASYDSTTGIWSLGAFPVNAYTNLILRARADTAGTRVLNAEITASTHPDPNSSPTQSFGVDDLGDGVADNDEASVSVNVQPAPRADLALTLSVDKATPALGDQVEFLLKVTNNGPQANSSSTLKALLPAGLTYVSHHGGTSYNSTTGVWTLGYMGNGATQTLHLRANTTSLGAKQLQAEITASALPDPNSSPTQSFGVDDLGDGTADNDEASVSVNVQPPPSADLALSMTVDDATPKQGDEIEFTLRVENSGPDTVSAVSLKSLLPAGLSYVSHQSGPSFQDVSGFLLPISISASYSSTSGIWTLGTLPVNAYTLLRLRARADTTGAKQMQAEITASPIADPNSDPAQSFGVDDRGDGTADNEIGRASCRERVYAPV